MHHSAIRVIASVTGKGVPGLEPLLEGYAVNTPMM
jgi:hypothetical protein